MDSVRLTREIWKKEETMSISSTHSNKRARGGRARRTKKGGETGSDGKELTRRGVLKRFASRLTPTELKAGDAVWLPLVARMYQV